MMPSDNFNLQLVAQKVANCLNNLTGDGWSWVQKNPEDRNWIGDIGHKDGYGIYLRYDSRRQRIEVRGEWLRDEKNNQYPYHNERPDGITMSATREPMAMAKDIRRRFLPDYLEAWNRGKEALAKHVAWRNGRAANLKRMCLLLGTTTHREGEVSLWSNDSEGRFHAKHIEAKCSGDEDVRLEIDVMVEWAEKVINFLRKESGK